MRVWQDHPYCAICGSNQNCSLHHIDGTTSSSIYNSIMLCHIHHKIADSHNTQSPLSQEFRANLRRITYARVIRSGHIDTENDKIYNENHRN